MESFSVIFCNEGAQWVENMIFYIFKMTSVGFRFHSEFQNLARQPSCYSKESISEGLKKIRADF